MISGFIESITERQVIGRVWDTERPEDRPTVRARIAGYFLAEAQANADGSDAQDPRAGKGARGFVLHLESPLELALRAVISVEAQGPASSAWVALPRLIHKTAALERVRSKAWVRENSAIRGPGDPTTMLNDEELRMLRWLTGRYYTGSGGIVDGGAFLGGSAVALCKGLRDAGWVGCLVDSYDLFVADAYAAQVYAKGRFVAGGSTRALYDEAVAPYADLLRVHEGDITEAVWAGGGIELLFLDCLKAHEVNDSCILNFLPHLIPGHSIVIQQDYLWDYLPWLHISMEMLWDYFELLCDTGYNSAVFLSTKPIPESALRAACWSAMSVDQRAAVMDRAIARWDGEKREHLLNAKRSGGLA